MRAPAISGDAVARKPTELSLNGDSKIPRLLSISLGREHLIVCLFVDRQKNRERVVYANTKFADCYLQCDKYTPALWVGSTAFDLTQDEAQQIRSAFEPVGMHIAGAL